MLHLDDRTIDSLIDHPSVTEAIADAFARWGRGQAATTQRVRAAASGQMVSSMAAVLPPYSGGKIYATHAGVFTFLNVLFDDRGQLLCTLDGDTITRLRTPAASALAIRELAVRDVRSAAVIGSGRQAWPHLQMLGYELPGLDRVALWARDGSAAAELTARSLERGLPAETASSASEAVEDADVIITVTSSPEPLFGSSVVSDRALICAVGATKYDRCEIDAATVGRCAVVCDDAAGSQIECGDLIEAVAAGTFTWDRAVELADVLAGNVSVPRAGDAPVLFETQGVALQDVAASALAYRYHLDGSVRPDRS